MVEKNPYEVEIVVAEVLPAIKLEIYPFTVESEKEDILLAVKNPVLTINACKVVGRVTDTPVSKDPSPINLPYTIPDEIEETNIC